MSAYRRILVAVDGSPTSMKGLREAIRLAKDDRAQLFIVHVVNELYAFANLEGLTAGVDIVPALREGGRRGRRPHRARGAQAARRPDRARHTRPARAAARGARQRCRAGRKALPRPGAAGTRAELILMSR